MAKKVTAYIKLQVPAAKANPAPPIGPALGQHFQSVPGFRLFEKGRADISASG